MSGDILVLVEHREGSISEGTFELLGRSRELAATSGGESVALLLGSGVEGLVAQLGAADRVILVEDPALARFTPTGFHAVLVRIIRDRSPLLLLAPNTAVGMDVAGGLSAATGTALAAYAIDVRVESGAPLVTSQLYAGKVNVRVRFAERRGIVTVVAGRFPAAAGQVTGAPIVERVSPAGADGRIRFRQLLQPVPEAVDITREDVLVSVGRGIGEAENIELAQELATALGGAVSASRPVADAGWLPRTRQVGKSGLRVKPKLYLALGISGAPEHLEGMRDAELIIAVNTDPRAPIFGVAHYGAVADVLEVIPALTQRLRA